MDEVLINAPCGFLSFNEAGSITAANNKLLELLGYKSDELLSADIDHIFSNAGRIYYQTQVFPLLKLRGEHSEVYISLRSKSGRDIPVLFNAARNVRNDTVFYDCVFVEMRRRDQYENEILNEKKLAEEANSIKDTFLATISHELRTPLNAILGWASMAQSGKLDADGTARAIRTIISSARSQAQLIEDLLDISRIISGKLRLTVAPVDVASVIQSAIDSVTLAAESKSIAINVEVDAQMGKISGDSERLKQVFWNLLTNAIKFTPNDGEIRILVKTMDSGLVLSFSDTGQGIDTEFLPYVFERFRQADGSTTRQAGGLGLGLAIVKNLVELHSGSISVHSEGRGLGATFTVVLPRQSGNSIEAIDRSKMGTMGIGHYLPAVPLPVLSGVRIVVIDDEEDNRLLLEAILRQSGAEVTVCSEASEAVEAVASIRPHVLISDIAMPVEDGYSLIKRVRANEKIAHTPAIALTGYTSVEDRIKVLSSGFQMFIPKPLEPSELIAAVTSLAGTNRG